VVPCHSLMTETRSRTGLWRFERTVGTIPTSQEGRRIGLQTPHSSTELEVDQEAHLYLPTARDDSDEMVSLGDGLCCTCQRTCSLLKLLELLINV